MAAAGREDGGVRVPRIVVLCIVVSFLVSALTTVLVSGLLPGEKEPAEAPSSSEPAAGGSSEIVPGSGGSRDSGAPLPREISDLREKVERRERQLAERGPAPSPDEAIREEEALARLTAIRRGERQFAIREAMEGLVKLGNASVPGILTILRSGCDQVWPGTGKNPRRSRPEGDAGAEKVGSRSRGGRTALKGPRKDPIGGARRAARAHEPDDRVQNPLSVSRLELEDEGGILPVPRAAHGDAQGRSGEDGVGVRADSWGEHPGDQPG